LGFNDKFSYTSPIPNFTEIRSVGAAPKHADGRTDGRKWRK